MRFHQSGYTKESSRLKEIRCAVKNHAPHFGVNKQREIARLLYEISKRDKTPPQKIISEVPFENYKVLKTILLSRRFPEATRQKEALRPYLPDFEFSRSSSVDLTRALFSPKKIFVEQEVESFEIIARLKKAFPDIQVKKIPSLKEYLKTQKGLNASDYNRRTEKVFVVAQEDDYFKKCPCTAGAQGCGYHIFNCGFGCVFECSYCFLQQYTNTPGIILPANLNAYFDSLKHYQHSGMRLGTGEFSDSLALDPITDYSKSIIDFLKNYPKVTFEFKTKSIHVANLLGQTPRGNIVVSWSLNPQKMIDRNEFLTPALNDRLKAAQACSKAGYKIGFHFDPLIHYPGWRKDYENVVSRIFDFLSPRCIVWISLGTFRFSPSLKPILEARFPNNSILDGELFLGYDNKLRYSFQARQDMYRHLLTTIRKFSKKIWVYLCMEDHAMHKVVGLKG
jgi:spore photoproduct lyase